MCEPIIQLGPPIRFRDKLYAEAKLGEGYHADIELRERTVGDEGHNLPLRPGTAQLGQDIGIEQPRHQNAISRTGMRSRPGSRSISL